MATPTRDEQTVNTNIQYNNNVKLLEEYAITVTYKYLHCKTPRGQFKESAPYLTRILKRSTSFNIIPEFRHTTGDIHYHGIICITDYIKWHKSTLPELKRLGFVCIKKIHKDLRDGWIKYYTKEIDIAKGILGDYFPLTSEIQFKPKDLKINNVMDNYILKDAEISVEQETREDDRKGVNETKEESSKE